MKGIKNIILDFGGVILNLDVNLTISAFNRISRIPFEEIYTQAKQENIFNLYDQGKISDYEFFTELRRLIRYEGPDEDMFFAWNAMLLDVPEHRLDLLVNLKTRYRTFLLSNTCETHISAFERNLYLHNGVKNFADYFDKLYYSCRVGMRKPDKEIFEMLLNKNKLKPEETVFIDDSEQHVRGAGDCGINAYLLPKNMELNDLLKELGLL